MSNSTIENIALILLSGVLAYLCIRIGLFFRALAVSQRIQDGLRAQELEFKRVQEENLLRLKEKEAAAKSRQANDISAMFGTIMQHLNPPGDDGE